MKATLKGLSVLRKLIRPAILILAMPWPVMGQSLIAGWDVSTQTNFGPITLPATQTHPGVTAGPLTKGSGVLMLYNSEPRGWGGHGWNYIDADMSIDNDAYFSFSLQPQPGYELSITSISPFDYKRVSTGPAQALLQYQINSGPFTDIQTISLGGFLTGGNSAGTINLSSVAELQNLNASQTVTFRIVPYGADNLNAVLYIYDRTNSTAIDFAINGTVAYFSQPTDHFRTKSSGDWTDITTWQSSTDNNAWNDATLVPDEAAADILIRNGHTVQLNANIVANALTVQSGGALHLDVGDTLFVADDPGADLTVDGHLIISPGGSVILKSDPNGTATIGNSSGTITGEVTVERHIPAKRAWRFLTAPVNSSTTIFANWQESGNDSLAGYGTHIMGPAGTGNGIDEGNVSFSMFGYDVSAVPNSWIAVTSTHQPGDVFSAGTGYRMFVRGDRTIPLGSATNSANETTLRATGTVLTGDIVFAGGTAIATHASLPPLDNDIGEFTLVGNPYPSTVDMAAVISNNSPGAATTGLNPNYYWVWDAQMSGSNNRGRYVVYDLEAESNNGAGSAVSRHLQSGQAFFVQTIAANPTLAFRESNKSDEQAAVFKTTSAVKKIAFELVLDDTVQADAAYVKFDDSFDPTVNFEDAGKLSNVDENLAIHRDGFNLSIEARPETTTTDTIRLNLWQLAHNAAYKLLVKTENLPAAINGFVRDNYLNTEYPLDLAGPTEVPFTVQTSDPASYGNSRFEVIIGTIPLTVEDISIQAEHSNQSVIVVWQSKNEQDIRQYSVERSADGAQFETQYTTSFNGTGLYEWADRRPFNGKAYYRIQAITHAGHTRYSKTVMTVLSTAKNKILIAPNPARSGQMQFSIHGLKAGPYLLTIHDCTGKIVYQNELSITADQSATHKVTLSEITSGTYTVRISGENEFLTEKVVFIQ